VPRVTAIVPERTGKTVLVELDGAPWRRVPSDVAVRTRLAVASELDRAALRRIRRELRRSEALAAATRALRHRDRSCAVLRQRLLDAGISPWACEQALDTLANAGFLDDARFARERARVLAARGCGDGLIRADLFGAGLSEVEVTDAVASLELEADRAAAVVGARGASGTTARWLARRGFGEDAIESALPGLVAGET
jgi:regulatory protein